MKWAESTQFKIAPFPGRRESCGVSGDVVVTPAPARIWTQIAYLITTGTAHDVRLVCKLEQAGYDVSGLTICFTIGIVCPVITRSVLFVLDSYRA